MLKTLSVSGFRNLEEQTIDFRNNQVIVITGANGSGKTSLLESLYVVLNGKSFRTSKTNSIITRDSGLDSFLIRACVASPLGAVHTVAIKKSLSERYIAKVDGQAVASIAELAVVIPSLVIEPRTFNILDGGAKSRKRLLDWAVFHVEHCFAVYWKTFSTVLKQRNTLLRNGRIDSTLLHSWDHQFIELSEKLDELRRKVFVEIQPIFMKRVEELLGPEIAVLLTMSYHKGWDNKSGLSDVLLDNAQRDIHRKTTHNGAHKADLRISHRSLPVIEGLSRGQQKIVVLSLVLALVEYVFKSTGKASILLMDDLLSELDEHNARRFIEALGEQQACTVITTPGIEPVEKLLPRKGSERIKMFHVEHGKVEQYQRCV